MTDARRTEIMAALQTLDKVSGQEWSSLMKADEEKLPYLIANIAGSMELAVRTLCPPGYEIDR